jgi:succinate dehydrogenase/fumarate reductase cytochrome b subunit
MFRPYATECRSQSITWSILLLIATLVHSCNALWPYQWPWWSYVSPAACTSPGWTCACPPAAQQTPCTSSLAIIRSDLDRYVWHMKTATASGFRVSFTFSAVAHLPLSELQASYVLINQTLINGTAISVATMRPNVTASAVPQLSSPSCAVVVRPDCRLVTFVLVATPSVQITLKPQFFFRDVINVDKRVVLIH